MLAQILGSGTDAWAPILAFSGPAHPEKRPGDPRETRASGEKRGPVWPFPYPIAGAAEGSRRRAVAIFRRKISGASRQAGATALLRNLENGGNEGGVRPSLPGEAGREK
jgi:hypothetical protein